jgi:hypothetical protein
MNLGCPGKPRLCQLFNNATGGLETPDFCDKNINKCNIKIGCYNNTKTQLTNMGSFGYNQEKPSYRGSSDTLRNCQWSQTHQNPKCT